MFMMENTLNKKQIQYNQELKEIETKKLDKEIQFVHPKCKPRETKYLECTDAAGRVPHPSPTRLTARRCLVFVFFFFFFSDSRRRGSICAESASIRAESG